VSQGENKENVALGYCTVSMTGSAGALNLGGKSFNIPEQATFLLQQAFKAMRDPSMVSKQDAVKVGIDKGKAAIEVERTEKVSTQAPMAEALELSKRTNEHGCLGII
jgi:hypothetical protein